jgi:hypothetical protein
LRAFAVDCGFCNTDECAPIDITDKIFENNQTGLLIGIYNESDGIFTWTDTIPEEVFDSMGWIDWRTCCPAENCENPLGYNCVESGVLSPTDYLNIDPELVCIPSEPNGCPAAVPECGYQTVLQPAIPLFNKLSWASVPEPWKSYLDQAANRWMKYVQFDQNAAQLIQTVIPIQGWAGISLNALDIYTDPQAGVIASCGPFDYVDLVTNAASVKFNTATFDLNINAAFESYYDACDWIDILTHELGHALGIGIYWHSFFAADGAVVPVNNFLSGAAYTNAQAAYNAAANLSRVKIPLEDGGGAGTVSAHWEPDFRPASAAGSGGEAHYGLFDELMVGFYDRNVTFKLSNISIQTLVDFGYQAVSPGTQEGDPTLTTNFTLPLLAQNAADGETADRVKLHCALPTKPRKIGTINLETQEAYVILEEAPSAAAATNNDETGGK